MVRMADVAVAAGVSITTVSHVLNRTRPVSDDLRRRVDAAVKATGYSPNIVARSLATRNSMVIGVVMSVLWNAFFGPLVSSIERTARQRGYTLLLTDSHEDAAKDRESVRVMLDRQVDGIIIAPAPTQSSDILDTLARSGTPTVLIDRFVEHQFDDVGVDNVDATAELVRHLAELGHTRIGFVHGKPGLSTTTERLAGYRLGLEQSGLHYDRKLVRSGGSRIDPASRAVQGMLSVVDPPTAVVPGNNAMTVGVLRGLRSIGAQVPNDVAIAAFDDLALADLLNPPLTAMAQPIERMGDLAARLLFKRIAGFDGPPARIVLPAKFEHRESCGCTS